MKRLSTLCLGLALLAGAAVAGDESETGESVLTLPKGLSLYRPNYLLPVTLPDDAEDEGDVEFKFQLSLQYQIAESPVFAAYTQESYFRWLDADDSRPFREVNHKPELWYRFRPGRLEPDWLGLDVGIEHQSNGEDQPDSRSWNRAYVRPWLEQGPWWGELKVWARVGEEDEPSTPEDPEGDDNPDILDFYGHHELRLAYRFDDGQRVSALTRYAFDTGRGALRLDYAHPTGGGGHWFVELFTGYGESLETFRENRTRIGVGFALMN